jgi:hypothetical protein
MLTEEVASIPIRKRKQPDEPESLLASQEVKRGSATKGRKIRLEQNRNAARESRRRKKVMIEELQRSVIFFSRANGSLKQQNEELTRGLMQAQAQVSVIESQGRQQLAQEERNQGQAEIQCTLRKPQEKQQDSIDQSQAHAVATQAIFESQGFPAAAARAAAQSLNASTPSESATLTPANSNSENLSQMQPGATMQAMANFQDAATAAMRVAVQGMQGNPGLSVSALSATPAGPKAQQVFNDTMAAFAMQQAATAALTGQQFLNNPFMAPMLAWQSHQAAMAAAGPGVQQLPVLAGSDRSKPSEQIISPAPAN